MTIIVLGATAILLSVLERLPQIRFKPSAVFRRYFMTDIIYMLTGFVAGGSLATLYILAVSEWFGSGLGLPRLASINLPLWSSIPLALVALDLGNYVAHYYLHRSDLLWEFHKIHHSSLTLDWLATFRSHIVEQIFRRLIAPAALIIVGFPLNSVLIAGGVFIVWAMLNHSNLRLNLGPLETVLITPRLHRVHHLYKTSEKNLGTIFTFWDRLRGTFVFVETNEKSLFGNGDAVYPQKWLSQLAEPVLRITRPGRRWAQ
jgi:sterol desaturase/sphingolipid hydroxylase (fatty acid hydroxylase superfamily)